MSQRVLLAGASGYIGRCVAHELLREGFELVALLRNGSRHYTQELESRGAPVSRLHCVECEQTDRQALEAALDGQRWDSVLSCVASRKGGIRDSETVEYGVNRNLLDLALARDCAHFTLLSAICVQKPRLAFQRAKLRFESELIASGLNHSIIRPTAFFKSLSGQLSRVRAGKPFLVFGDGEITSCKPIAESDLARLLRRSLETPELCGVQPVGGPGPAITPRMQAELLSRLLGREVPLRSVPPSLLLWIARVAALPGTVVPSLADKAEFARIGHYYATESMLLWDAVRQRYNADATPEFGERTLEESYSAQLAGTEAQHLGDQAMF